LNQVLSQIKSLNPRVEMKECSVLIGGHFYPKGNLNHDIH